jgi:DNA-directed RNA polymerase subunit RPC12/RpoP
MAKRFQKNGYKCDKCNTNFEKDDSVSSQVTVQIQGELTGIYDLCPTCSTLFMEKHNAGEAFSMKY